MTTIAAKPIHDLLTRTRAKADQRHAADREAYAKLVRQAAEGRELEPDAVLKQLDRLGRDATAFQADVEALAERMLLKSQVDGIAALTSERAEVERTINNTRRHSRTRSRRPR